jgi:hypothetical protein
MDGKACLEVQLPNMSFIFDLILLVFVTFFVVEIYLVHHIRKLEKKYHTPDINGFYPIVPLEIEEMNWGIKQKYPRWPNVCSDCGLYIGGCWNSYDPYHEGHCRNYYHIKKVAYEYVTFRKSLVRPDPKASEAIKKD